MRAAVHYTAAHTCSKIGGDLYDVLQTRYGLRAVVGDVQGKGLGAVEPAAAMLGAFREAAHQEPTLDRLARRLADRLDRTPGRDGEQFVTAVLMGVRPDAAAEVSTAGTPARCCCAAPSRRAAWIRPAEYHPWASCPQSKSARLCCQYRSGPATGYCSTPTA
jgi:stage II sporulation SpoE-like protein